MRGSGCVTASSASLIGRSGSYSTRIRSSAAVATSSLVAATAATGSPMKRTFSTHSACSSCETGRIPKGIGRSGPVSTACTPSRRAAGEASIETMRAWGWVLRSSLQYSIRGKARSSANFVVPVTFATASTLRCAFPMTLWAPIERFPRRLDLLAAHARRCKLNGLVDLDVARAAAEVAGEGVLDLVARGLRVLDQQSLGRKQERRGAVPALGSAQVREGLLQRVEPAFPRHPFDRFDGAVRAGEAEHEARQHRCTVEQHLQQRLGGCERDLGRLVVDEQRDRDLRSRHVTKRNLDYREMRRQLWCSRTQTRSLR